MLAAACASTPEGPAPASDRYETCSDPAGKAALAAANERFAGGDQAGALPLLQRAITLCPDLVRSHRRYIETALALGGSAEAEMRAFYAQPRDEANSPVWPYARALLAEADDVREKLIQQALARDGSFYWGYLSLARMLRGVRNTARATEMLHKALSARPDFPEARLELAEILAGLGRLEEAVVEYANYLAARPDDRLVQQHYVHLLIYGLGRQENAVPLVHAMYRQDPDDVEVLFDMAALAWNAGKPEEAAERYRHALRLEPSNKLAALNLGNVYYDALGRAGDQAARDRAWQKARKAYLYYLQLDRTDNLYDFADHYLAVPYRLRQIEKRLGPDDGAPPSLDDF